MVIIVAPYACSDELTIYVQLDNNPSNVNYSGNYTQFENDLNTGMRIWKKFEMDGSVYVINWNSGSMSWRINYFEDTITNIPSDLLQFIESGSTLPTNGVHIFFREYGDEDFSVVNVTWFKLECECQWGTLVISDVVLSDPNDNSLANFTIAGNIK